MDITWYGHSCFRIVERGQTTIVTDPYAPQIGLPELKLKADIVTVSHDEPGHNALEYVKYNHTLNGAGEYEIGGVFITGVAMHYVDEEQGVVRPNIAYHIQYYSTGLTVMHLGDLVNVPEQSTVEKLGEVNVLLIPVGGGKTLKAGLAAEVIAMIEPNYIIPMHYQLPNLAFELDPVEKFLKAMGVSRVQEEDMLRVIGSDLPEQPQVIMLRPPWLSKEATDEL